MVKWKHSHMRFTVTEKNLNLLDRHTHPFSFSWNGSLIFNRKHWFFHINKNHMFFKRILFVRHYALTCTSTHMSTHSHVHEFTCPHVRAWTCPRTFIHVPTQSRTHTLTYLHTPAFAYLRTHWPAHSRTCECARLRTCVHAHSFTHVLAG